MAELVLYTNPMSRGRIARWMLEEVGAPYRAEILDYGGSMKAPEFLAINPMGKVPALVHGATVVTEGAAICAYLADAFPEAGLAPPTAERGAYYRWLFFAAGPLEAAVINRAMGWDAPDRRQMLGYGSYGAVLDTLEGVLKGLLGGAEYIAGPRFSAADLYLGAHINWGMQFGTIERRPAFEAYAARVTDRDACRRAAAADEALTRAAQG
jgi:glutathione S-transferase